MPRFIARKDKADLQWAKSQIGLFRGALQRYALDTRDFPTTEQGLQALLAPPTDADESTLSGWQGPYLDMDALPKDPWGNEYQYTYPPERGSGDIPDIWSWGPDGEDGTDDDVTVSSVRPGVEAPFGDKATLRRVELVNAISSWTRHEVNWLDELRNLSTHFPVARDAMVLRMSMQPSPSGGGRISMQGVVRDPIILVKMEEQLRKSHGRVQSRLEEDQRHREPGSSWLFEETIVVLPPEIEEPGQDNIPQVLKQLTKYESQSLPGNGEIARLLYKAWLVELVEEVRMLNPSVESGAPFSQRGRYQTLSFGVRARGTLEQLKDFLFSFYQTDLLHQIRSLSITSVSKESQLDLAMAIEVLVLEQVAAGGSDGDQQAAFEEFRRRSGRVSDRLEFQRLEDYELIVQRNLFDAVGNDEPNRPRIPAASDAPLGTGMPKLLPTDGATRIPAASDAPLGTETRSPSEFFVPRDRLPKGLPSWFLIRDADGDGQVTLAEYAPDVSASSIREFARYDGNGDGVLTPQEYLRGTNAAKSEDATPDEVEKPAMD